MDLVKRQIVFDCLPGLVHAIKLAFLGVQYAATDQAVIGDDGG
ncbi:MAG: hypothetical protein JWQ66_1328 [Mucilaginibacter sp.]|nr:hypothetical protein [Mucilaginibacter sp.]